MPDVLQIVISLATFGNIPLVVKVIVSFDNTIILI